MEGWGIGSSRRSLRNKQGVDFLRNVLELGGVLCCADRHCTSPLHILFDFNVVYQRYLRTCVFLQLVILYIHRTDYLYLSYDLHAPDEHVSATLRDHEDVALEPVSELCFDYNLVLCEFGRLDFRKHFLPHHRPAGGRVTVACSGPKKLNTLLSTIHSMKMLTFPCDHSACPPLPCPDVCQTLWHQGHA